MSVLQQENGKNIKVKVKVKSFVKKNQSKSKEFGYDTNETEEYSQVKHTHSF